MLLCDSMIFESLLTSIYGVCRVMKVRIRKMFKQEDWSQIMSSGYYSQTSNKNGNQKLFVKLLMRLYQIQYNLS